MFVFIKGVLQQPNVAQHLACLYEMCDLRKGNSELISSTKPLVCKLLA